MLDDELQAQVLLKTVLDSWETSFVIIPGNYAPNTVLSLSFFFIGDNSFNEEKRWSDSRWCKGSCHRK
jgi:hypothetical protein